MINKREFRSFLEDYVNIVTNRLSTKFQYNIEMDNAWYFTGTQAQISGSI